MSIISVIKANTGKYLARGAGAAALYLCARDAHAYGKIKADVDLKSKNARAAQYYLNNTLTADSPSMSRINIKNWTYKYELSDNLRGFFNSTVGYFKGFGSMLVSDVCVWGLGLTALLAKGKTLPILSGLGLAGIGVYSFIKDGLGIGKPSDLTIPLE